MAGECIKLVDGGRDKNERKILDARIQQSLIRLWLHMTERL